MSNPFLTIYRNPEYENANKLPLREFPFIVDVELTNHCNLMCKMCPRNVMKRKRGFMEFSTFKSIIDECKKYSAAIRMIRFGEPLMNPNFAQFLRYAKENNVTTHLTTNGLFLDKVTSENIIDIGLDSIIFSFQGATKEGYQDMRDTNQYDLLESNIKQLAKIRKEKGKNNPWIHISSTMTNETNEEISKFKTYWEGIVDSVGVGKTNFAVIDNDEHHDKIKDYLPKETLQRKYMPCTEVYQKLSIDWNGDITACCGDFDSFLLIGNIQNTTLKEVWEGKKLNNIRSILDQMRMQELPLCRDCYHTYKEF